MKRATAAALILALSASGASAQEAPDHANCRNEALPFPASDANRLSDDQLRQLLNGKTFLYVRAHTRSPGVYVRLGRELRGDGSMRSTCEFSRSREGAWKLCARHGSEKRKVAGAHDVGVWRTENRALCFVHAAFNTTTCVAIHRQGGAVAAKYVSGPRSYCAEGPVSVQ